MGEGHRTPAFQNAVEYVVTLAITVRGGAQHGTADRRARRVAERLADTAARCPDVAEVTATAGPGHDDEAFRHERVRFSAANTGTGTYGQPDKLDRYLDPEHELALRSLGKANEAYRQRQRDDRQRRHAVSCLNTYSLVTHEHYCVCVYCAPARHLDSIQALRQHPDNPFVERYCLCGQQVPAAGDRCPRHRSATVVVLEGDDLNLRRLTSELDRGHDRPGPSAPPHERRPPPDHGLER